MRVYTLFILLFFFAFRAAWCVLLWETSYILVRHSPLTLDMSSCEWLTRTEHPRHLHSSLVIFPRRGERAAHGRLNADHDRKRVRAERSCVFGGATLPESAAR